MEYLFTNFRQIKAARSLLDWSQKDLADKSGVSLSTLNRMERGDGEPSVSSLKNIHKALFENGVVFINNPDGSVGVYLNPEGAKKAGISPTGIMMGYLESKTN